MTSETDRAERSGEQRDDKISGQLKDAAELEVLSSAEVLRRFKALENRIGIVESEIAENTAITTGMRDELRTGIGKDLKEMVDMFASLKGGLKVMGWLGTFAKWIAGVGAAFAAIYAIVQNIRGFK